jgi:hypothetical protein
LAETSPCVSVETNKYEVKLAKWLLD